MFAPSDSAWISLSVLIPIGFFNNHPSLSHKRLWSSTSTCFKTSGTESNQSLMSTATSSTSDCMNTCWIIYNKISSIRLIRTGKKDHWMSWIGRSYTCPPGIKLSIIESTNGFCKTRRLWCRFLKWGSGHCDKIKHEWVLSSLIFNGKVRVESFGEGGLHWPIWKPASGVQDMKIWSV